METAKNPKKIDKYIPWMFVAFFAVIFAVNGVFVTMALKTKPGVIIKRSYEQGLDYNQTLAAAAAQDALGLVSNITYNDGVLSLSLRDAEGGYLPGAVAEAVITRPAKKADDFSTPLILSYQGNGVYSEAVTFPKPGQWHIRIKATWQDNRQQHQNAQFTKTIIAP